MRPKNDLLIFSKKEIFVILLLLVLVALFSFTIGVRLGKRLGPVTATVASGDKPPFEAAHMGEEDEVEVVHGGEEHADSGAPVSEKLSHKAQDLADSQLAEQVTEQKVASGKAMPMKFPASKVAKHLYTLQVGSHKSVSEASNQVGELKKKSLDAFYMEALVPGVGTRYRVAVGKYNSKEAAENAGAEMKKAQQLPDYIIQKVSGESEQ